MRRFFDVFLFEDTPASDRRPDDLYLDEVERADIYVGLFGSDYGSEDDEGISPTEREFDHATAVGSHRLIFVKGGGDCARHSKMRALIGKAQTGLIRKRFNMTAELVAGLYAALVEYLEVKNLIRWGPFDAAPCAKATVNDLDVEWIARFTRTARRARQFPLAEDTPVLQLLEHLNLLNEGRLTNAAVLLFGKSPQRFLISSEARCAHFHGTEVAEPIPSYQVYKGYAFELVDQAVDFVLSKIYRSIGTRAEGVRAPRTYEIPVEVVTEAIVNAVAHRDYTDNGSVQVMLFADRPEVRNPGRFAPPLTLEKLREAHRSVPGNPLLAESMYLAEYIERMGTGTLDMIRRCVEAGLPEPEFAVADGFVTTVWRALGSERVTGGAEERVTGVDGERSDPQSEPSGEREPAGVQEGGQEGQREDEPGGHGVQAGVQAGVHVGVQGELEARDTDMLRACVRADLTSKELQNAGGYAGANTQLRAATQPPPGRRVAGIDRSRQAQKSNSEVPPDGQGAGCHRIDRERTRSAERMNEEPEGQIAEDAGAKPDAGAEMLIDILTGRAVRSTPKNRLVQKALRQLIETYGFDRSVIRTGYRPTVKGKRPGSVDIVIFRRGEEPADKAVERVRIGGHVRTQIIRPRQRHVDDELPVVAQRYRAFIDGGRVNQ